MDNNRKPYLVAFAQRTDVVASAVKLVRISQSGVNNDVVGPRRRDLRQRLAHTMARHQGHALLLWNLLRRQRMRARPTARIRAAVTIQGA